MGVNPNQFWAKSLVSETCQVQRLNIPHHSMNVAAVGWHLWSLHRPPAEIGRATVAALLALHDVGKFTRTFQGKVEALWPEAALGPYRAPPAGHPHDAEGYRLLEGPLAGHLRGHLWDLRPMNAPDIINAIAGHHGRPVSIDGKYDVNPLVTCAACVAAAEAFTDAALGVIAPPPLPDLRGAAHAAFVWWLAGFTTLADWIGSGWRWFPPIPSGDHEDLAAYWNNVALPSAARAVAEAGLRPAAVAPATGLAALFPAITAARPLQAWAERVAIPDGPTLFVIEDATGAGKTEAAMVLAHRLLRAGCGRGIYFALPTMATANAMYARLAAAYERLFEPGAKPSLVLSHGKRWLNPAFSDSVLRAAAGVPEVGRRDAEPADEPGEAQCAAWIADDRRLAFLADIGVGTIDQALMAVLPARHATLRLLGLSGCVLIVDEAHAYDPYMTAELARLLEFHAALGGSAIVLSATLTASGRSLLARSFGRGLRAELGEPEATAYPLATIVSATELREEPLAVSVDLRRHVTIERVPDSGAAVDAVVHAACLGGAVAWVRNTVDDAIGAAELLRARGLAPMLFHARFAMGDRLDVERQVLARFGKDAPLEARDGAVLVATQVVEQSLDLDFDLMVSDLAPADLLIQRAGRVWRHRRDARPVPGPKLLLLSPEPVATPGADWLGPELRGTGAVYRDVATLWRSARALLADGIEVPGNVRALVEAALDRDDEPPAFETSSFRAEAARLTQGAVASQNLLTFGKPYRRDAGLWEPDVRTPTRLTEPTVTVRLARLDGGTLRPICDDPEPARAWALSEVSLSASRFAGPAPGPATDGMVAALRAGWSRWEREVPVLVLHGPPDGPLTTIARDKSSTAITLTYSRDAGLRYPARQ